MGFNTVRKHVKAEPARWYYHCDVLAFGLAGYAQWLWRDCTGKGSRVSDRRNHWPGIIKMERQKH